jgi:hypothetical protein
MRQLTILDNDLPECAASSCPACGGRSRNLGRRGSVAVYKCPTCGLSFDVHDPNAMNPQHKRKGPGAPNARPSVTRRCTDPIQRDPRRGGSIHV